MSVDETLIYAIASLLTEYNSNLHKKSRLYVLFSSEPVLGVRSLNMWRFKTALYEISFMTSVTRISVTKTFKNCFLTYIKILNSKL